MDHLPPIQSPSDRNTYCAVPYLSGGRGHKFSYDGKIDFSDFPANTGFETLRWVSHNDLQNETVWDVVTFYQSWCFFAFVICFLRIGGINVSIEDFVRDGNVVTTHRLHSLLLKFSHISQLRTLEERTHCYQRLDEILERIGTVTQGLSLMSRARPENKNYFLALENVTESTLLVVHMVHLSVVLLAEQLGHAILFYAPQKSVTWRKYAKYVWGSSMLVDENMLFAGWCPSDVAVLKDQEISVSGMYILSRMDRQSLGRDHDECVSLKHRWSSYRLRPQKATDSKLTKLLGRKSRDINDGWYQPSFRCLHENLDPTVYQTRHVDDCDESQCSHLDFEPEFGVARVSRLLRRDLIPIIRVDATGDGGKPKVTVMVTSQSLGQTEETVSTDLHSAKFVDIKNPEALKATVEQPFPYICISHVWADGLGNPNNNSLPLCQLLRLQRQVHELFPAFTQPVPFWIDSICVPLQPKYRRKAVMMMKWTYAEAIAVLVIERSLSHCSSSAEPAELMWRIQASAWSRRLWTYHESGLGRQLFYRFCDKSIQLFEIYDRIIETHKVEMAQIIAESTEPTAPEIVLEHMFEQDATFDRSSMEAFSWCFQAEHLDISLDLSKHDGQRLATVARLLCYRWTSWLQDEAICLAGLLNKDASNLTRIASADERMKRLILSLDQVPSQIVFLEARRVQQDGCRWIPASLLGRGDHAQFLLSREETSTPSRKGLVIDAAGIIFTVPAILSERDVSSVKAGRAPPFTTTPTKRIRQRLLVRVNNAIYGIYPSDSTTLQWTKLKAKRVGVILQTSVNEEGGPLQLHNSIAVVLLTDRKGLDQPIVTGRHEAAVYIRGPPQLDTTLVDHPEVVESVETRLEGGKWQVK